MVVFPNAKINIGLYVTEKRRDGFHNLETVFYPIDLFDILEIIEKEGKKGECVCKTTGIDIKCDTEANLIVKAYRMLDADFHLPAVEVHLHKLIPFGAGLGGGSADAAFMLKALNDLFGLSLDVVHLKEYATRLGSDCAFFICNRPAFASGKGERLEEIPLSLKAYRLVLLKPPFGVSTPEAYAGITPHAAAFDLRYLKDSELENWKEYVRNDFEATVFAKYPYLAEVKQYLYGLGAVYVSMTGSGSAIYALFPRDSKVKIECPDCFVWQED